MLTEEPDYDLDAYLCKGAKRGPLCDVRLWLPKQPKDNGRIETVAIGAQLQQLSGLSLLWDEDPSFRFEATDLLIRSANYRLGRRAGGTRLNIVDIGLLSICRGQAVKARKEIGPAPQHVVWRLSDFRYGLPAATEIVDYRGNRTMKKIGAAPVLEMGHASGFVCRFRLDRHWNWTSNKDSVAILGRSCPVLELDAVPAHPAVTLKTLTECAADAALYYRWPRDGV